MNKINKSIILSLLLLTSMVLLSLKLTFSMHNHIAYIYKSLNEYLPSGNWKSVKLDQNELEMKKIKSLLNFDDYLYVENQGLKIFIAYWTPGKMPYDLVGFHCPDVCLIEAGWKKEAEGVFSKNGLIKYIDFKHFVGGKEVHYEHYGYQKDILSRVKRYMTKFTDIFKFGLNTKYDQLVVRIESDEPLESSELYKRILMNKTWMN